MESTKYDPYAISKYLDPSIELQGEKFLADDFVESIEDLLNIIEIQSTHQLLDQAAYLDQYITLRQPYYLCVIIHVNPIMNLVG